MNRYVYQLPSTHVSPIIQVGVSYSSITDAFLDSNGASTMDFDIFARDIWK
jgi:hypothetical protein